MARSWASVVSSKAYQDLSDDDKEAARKQYFDEVVAPKVNPSDLSEARKQFDDDTKPSFMDRVSNAASNGITAIHDYLTDTSKTSLPRDTISGISQTVSSLGSAAASAMAHPLDTVAVATSGLAHSAGKLMRNAGDHMTANYDPSMGLAPLVAGGILSKAGAALDSDTVKNNLNQNAEILQEDKKSAAAAVEKDPSWSVSTLQAGLDSTAKDLADTSRFFEETKSDELKRQAQDQNEHTGWSKLPAMATDWRATLDSAATSLPYMIAGWPASRAGAAIALTEREAAHKAGLAAAEKVADSLPIQEAGELSSRAAIRSAYGKAYGDYMEKLVDEYSSNAAALGEAGGTMIQNSQQVHDRIMELKPEQLAHSDRFNELVKQYNGDSARAQQVLASELSAESMIGGVATFLGGLIINTF